MIQLDAAALICVVNLEEVVRSVTPRPLVYVVEDVPVGFRRAAPQIPVGVTEDATVPAVAMM